MDRIQSKSQTEANMPILSSPAPAEPIHNVPCGICHRQFSKYACARCNIPYCSLPCYRSEKHADCSESFAKRELETEIKGAPTKSKEERQQMLELLKRFEEEDAKDEENDDDEDELTLRLSSIDLESASHEKIWATLTPEERTRFTRALHNPDSDLLKELLASEVIEHSIIKPWWESEEYPHISTIAPRAINRARHGVKPDMLDVPADLHRNASAEVALALVYNAVHISLAYAYVTRHLSFSPLSQAADVTDRDEAKRLLNQLVPFLADRKSQIRHPNLQTVVTDIWGRLHESHHTEKLLAILLEDASRMVCPTILSELGDSDNELKSAPCQHLLLCLSDIHALFNQSRSKRDVGVVHKVLFYAAHMSVMPTALWQGLSEQLAIRARRERGGGD